MQHINSYIIEKLRIGKSIKYREYFKPQNITELNEYVKQQTLKAPKHGSFYGTLENPVDLSYIDFSDLLNNKDGELEMYFYTGHDDLYAVDASDWIFNQYVDDSLDHLFAETQLRYIDVSNWDINNIRLLTGLFCECEHLNEIKGLNTWKLHSVRRLGAMFKGCTQLKQLDLSNWDVTSIKKCNQMFRNCSSLQYVNLTNWNTKNIENFDRCFEDCVKLQTIDGIENFDLSNCKNISHMFNNCSQLQANIDNWKFKSTKPEDMPNGFGALKNTQIKPSWVADDYYYE